MHVGGEAKMSSLDTFLAQCNDILGNEGTLQRAALAVLPVWCLPGHYAEGRSRKARGRLLVAIKEGQRPSPVEEAVAMYLGALAFEVLEGADVDLALSVIAGRYMSLHGSADTFLGRAHGYGHHPHETRRWLEEGKSLLERYLAHEDEPIDGLLENSRRRWYAYYHSMPEKQRTFDELTLFLASCEPWLARKVAADRPPRPAPMTMMS